jgi:hypothetical protein
MELVSSFGSPPKLQTYSNFNLVLCFNMYVAQFFYIRCLHLKRLLCLTFGTVGFEITE